MTQTSSSRREADRQYRWRQTERSPGIARPSRRVPGDARAHDYLGSALALQGKFDEAIAAFREAVRLKPNEGHYRLDLAYALHSAGKPDDAVSALREAIRLNPDNLSAQVNLGNGLASQGKFDEAIAAFARQRCLNQRIHSFKCFWARRYHIRESTMRRQPPSASQSGSRLITLTPRSILATHWREPARLPKQSTPTARRSASTPATPRLMRISALPCLRRENTTKRSPLSVRQSGSLPITQTPRSSSATCCHKLGN